MYLSVSYNVPGTKSVTSGVVWHVAPESKIQLVNFKLSPYFTLLRLSSLYMRAIDAYILWSSLSLPLSHARLPFNEKGNCACDNGEDENEHSIYASMAQMSSDDERKSVKYGDSSQLTN